MVTTKDGGDAPTLAFEHASTSMCAEETPPKVTTRYGNAKDANGIVRDQGRNKDELYWDGSIEQVIFSKLP
jgi:hypothetical protein